MTDLVDIAEHTVPTVLVGAGMGFMCAFGLHTDSNILQMVFYVAASALGTYAFSCLWVERERRQHEGHIGGPQSMLEAWVPFWGGIGSYVASTCAFFIWPL